MEQVIKVSIAGCSFTLEQEACRILDTYLNELKGHYARVSGGDEIIEDIEERISELIFERGERDRVISREEIEGIIGILGRPADIEGGDSSGRAGREGEPVQKKLYRDPDRKIAGGVCSGLAAYLNIRTSGVRVLYLAFFFILTCWLGKFPHLPGFIMGWFSVSVVVYAVLWAVIPEARTVTQRCAMRGETPGLENIWRNLERERKSRRPDRTGGIGSTLVKTAGSVLAKIAGVLLCLTGVGGLVTGWLIFMGLEVFNGLSLLTVADYVQLNASVLWIKILGLMVWFLPFVGMLYGGIRILSGMKRPKFRPGLILFLLWLVCLAGLAVFTVRAIRPYTHRSESGLAKVPVKTYDTLYVKYIEPAGNEEARMYVEARSNQFRLGFMNRREGVRGMEFVTYPRLKVIRQDGASDSFLECSMSAYSPLKRWGESRRQAMVDKTVSVQDSLIRVSPKIYSRQQKYDGKKTALRLYVPENTVVIVTDPVYHTFGDSSYITENGVFWDEGFLGIF